MGCDVALGDNQIPKFRRNVQTLSLRVKKFYEIEFFDLTDENSAPLPKRRDPISGHAAS